MTHESLDDPGRIHELRAILKRKKSLRLYYAEVYERFRGVVARAGAGGVVLELGSGGGFAQSLVDGLVTSDVTPYDGIDRVEDASRLSFADGELKAILLFNVFHHLADAEAFLSEARRCLKPGGRVLIVDQYPGWICHPILKYLHHEGYDPHAGSWSFESRGPLSGANGALAWIVFFRDRAVFERKFPELEIASIRLHSPFQYWLTGGLKRWSLLPTFLFGIASLLDRVVVWCVPSFASFVDVELVKRI